MQNNLPKTLPDIQNYESYSVESPPKISLPLIIHSSFDKSSLQEIKKYIEDKIVSDGHCGFRSIALALGRNQNEYSIIRRDLANFLQKKNINSNQKESSYLKDLIDRTQPIHGEICAPESRYFSSQLVPFLAEFHKIPIVFYDANEDAGPEDSFISLPDISPINVPKFDPMILFLKNKHIVPVFPGKNIIMYPRVQFNQFTNSHIWIEKFLLMKPLDFSNDNAIDLDLRIEDDKLIVNCSNPDFYKTAPENQSLDSRHCKHSLNDEDLSKLKKTFILQGNNTMEKLKRRHLIERRCYYIKDSKIILVESKEEIPSEYRFIIDLDSKIS